MPVYEYECSSCGDKTQRLQRVGEDSSGNRCLMCGRGSLKKVFSPLGMAGREFGSCAPSEQNRYR